MNKLENVYLKIINNNLDNRVIITISGDYMRNIYKFFCILSIYMAIFIPITVSAESAYDEAVKSAQDDKNTCIYTDSNKQYVYGYTVSSGLWNNKAKYKFYLFGGSKSDKTYSDSNAAAVYDKNSCNPYVIACLNDNPMNFYYKKNDSTFAINYKNTSCQNGATTLSLINPYMSQTEGIDQASQKYSCVYRDNNDTIAATNYKSTLGQINVSILRYNGEISDEVVSVAKPNISGSGCPSYFLYAKQSPSGSFGGTGNDTFYSTFGNDFDTLCKTAKEHGDLYEVLTRSDLPITNTCSKRSENSSIDSDEPLGEPFDDVGYQNMDCYGLLGMPGDPNSPAYWLQLALQFIRYLGIAALVIMSTIDFIQAITKQDSDALKAAINKSVRRFIFAVILFFVPLMVSTIMDLFGVYGTCAL